MKTKLTRGVAALVMTFGFDALSQSLLTQAYLEDRGDGVSVITNSLNLTIGIGAFFEYPSALLFEDLFVRTTDAGRTFRIGPGDDPDFARFVGYLTDGQLSYLSDYVNVGPGGAGTEWIPEPQFFSGLPPGNNGRDLAGFQIDYFTLRFDALQIVSPGSDPNGDGVWTDASCSVTFSVYGQPIPEPASLTMVLLGAALLRTRIGRVTRPLQRTGGYAPDGTCCTGARRR